ncbi:MAG: hypothetical protein P8J32_04745 [bacterium]|nr:hypothetical protein [bacterium]
MNTKRITLPCYGIIVVLSFNDEGEVDGSALTSELKGEDNQEDELYNAAVDGIESLILAHAAAGIDIENPAYIEGIETAAEAAANNL